MDIQTGKIPLSNINYNVETNRFKYSSRREIDWNRVQQIQKSIEHTGFWDPIIIQKKSMLGIDGNHRFLAMLGIAKKRKQNLNDVHVLAILIDCSDDEAVTLGYFANEIRAYLTTEDRIRGVLITSKKMPQATEDILGVNKDTAIQLSFWVKSLNSSEENHQSITQHSQALLNSEWLETIHDLLEDYPTLHQTYIERIRLPWWVQSHTLQDLRQDILAAIIGLGREFKSNKTWNHHPAQKCLGSAGSWKNIRRRIFDRTLVPSINQKLPETCEYLRCQVQKAIEMEPVVKTSNASDTKSISKQGDFSELVINIRCFCSDPNLNRANSCFYNVERDKQQELIHETAAKNIKLISEEDYQEKKANSDFIWLQPELNSAACTPQNCRHSTNETVPFLLIARPDQKHIMACVNVDCGIVAYKEHEKQQALEEQQIFEEIKNQRSSFNIDTVTHTLRSVQTFTQLSTATLQAIEKLLVPEWHRQRICEAWDDYAAFLQNDEDNTRPDIALHNQLISVSNINDKYLRLREAIIRNEYGLQRWVTFIVAIRAYQQPVALPQEIADE